MRKTSLSSAQRRCFSSRPSHASVQPLPFLLDTHPNPNPLEIAQNLANRRRMYAHNVKVELTRKKRKERAVKWANTSPYLARRITDDLDQYGEPKAIDWRRQKPLLLKQEPDLESDTTYFAVSVPEPEEGRRRPKSSVEHLMLSEERRRRGEKNRVHEGGAFERQMAGIRRQREEMLAQVKTLARSVEGKSQGSISSEGAPAIGDSLLAIARWSRKMQRLLDWCHSLLISQSQSYSSGHYHSTQMNQTSLLHGWRLFDDIFFTLRKYGVPSERAYNLLIAQCAVRSAHLRSLRVLDSMISSGVRPNHRTLDNMVRCLVNGRHWSELVDLLHSWPSLMNQHGRRRQREESSTMKGRSSEIGPFQASQLKTILRGLCDCPKFDDSATRSDLVAVVMDLMLPHIHRDLKKRDDHQHESKEHSSDLASEVQTLKIRETSQTLAECLDILLKYGKPDNPETDAVLWVNSIRKYEMWSDNQCLTQQGFARLCHWNAVSDFDQLCRLCERIGYVRRIPESEESETSIDCDQFAHLMSVDCLSVMLEKMKIKKSENPGDAYSQQRRELLMEGLQLIGQFNERFGVDASCNEKCMNNVLALMRDSADIKHTQRLYSAMKEKGLASKKTSLIVLRGLNEICEDDNWEWFMPAEHTFENDSGVQSIQQELDDLGDESNVRIFGKEVLNDAFEIYSSEMENDNNEDDNGEERASLSKMKREGSSKMMRDVCDSALRLYGVQLREFSSVMEIMLKMRQNGISLQKCDQTVSDMLDGLMIDQLCKNGEWSNIAIFLDELWHNQLRPSGTVYSRMVRMLGRHGWNKEFLACIDRSVMDGIVLKGPEVSAWMHDWSRKASDEKTMLCCLSLLDKASRWPDLGLNAMKETRLMNDLLYAYGNRGDLDGLRMTMQHMVETDICDNDTRSIFVEGLLKNAKQDEQRVMDEVNDLVDEWMNQDIPVPWAALSAIFEHLVGIDKSTMIERWKQREEAAKEQQSEVIVSNSDVPWSVVESFVASCVTSRQKAPRQPLIDSVIRAAVVHNHLEEGIDFFAECMENREELGFSTVPSARDLGRLLAACIAQECGLIDSLPRNGDNLKRLAVLINESQRVVEQELEKHASQLKSMISEGKNGPSSRGLTKHERKQKLIELYERVKRLKDVKLDAVRVSRCALIAMGRYFDRTNGKDLILPLRLLISVANRQFDSDHQSSMNNDDEHNQHSDEHETDGGQDWTRSEARWLETTLLRNKVFQRRHYWFTLLVCQSDLPMSQNLISQLMSAMVEERQVSYLDDSCDALVKKGRVRESQAALWKLRVRLQSGDKQQLSEFVQSKEFADICSHGSLAKRAVSAVLKECGKGAAIRLFSDERDRVSSLTQLLWVPMSQLRPKDADDSRELDDLCTQIWDQTGLTRGALILSGLRMNAHRMDQLDSTEHTRWLVRGLDDYCTLHFGRLTQWGLLDEKPVVIGDSQVSGRKRIPQRKKLKRLTV